MGAPPSPGECGRLVRLVTHPLRSPPQMTSRELFTLDVPLGCQGQLARSLEHKHPSDTPRHTILAKGGGRRMTERPRELKFAARFVTSSARNPHTRSEPGQSWPGSSNPANAHPKNNAPISQAIKRTPTPPPMRPNNNQHSPHQPPSPEGTDSRTSGVVDDPPSTSSGSAASMYPSDRKASITSASYPCSNPSST